MDKQEEQLKDFKHLRENIARIMDISLQTMETLQELPPNQEKALQHASDFVENLKMVRDQFEKKLGRLNTAMPTAPCSTHLDHLEADVHLFEEMLATQGAAESEQQPSRQAQRVHYIPADAEHTTAFPPLRHPSQASAPAASTTTSHGMGSSGGSAQQAGAETLEHTTHSGVQPPHAPPSSAATNGRGRDHDGGDHTHPVMDLLPDRNDADVAVPVSTAASGGGGGGGVEEQQQQPQVQQGQQVQQGRQVQQGQGQAQPPQQPQQQQQPAQSQQPRDQQPQQPSQHQL